MNLLLKYGGPYVNFGVGLVIVCGCVGSLFRIRHFTLRDVLGLIVVLVIGISCLAVSHSAMRRR
jgi:hypothetical protein